MNDVFNLTDIAGPEKTNNISTISLIKDLLNSQKLSGQFISDVFEGKILLSYEVMCKCRDALMTVKQLNDVIYRQSTAFLDKMNDLQRSNPDLKISRDLMLSFIIDTNAQMKKADNNFSVIAEWGEVKSTDPIR